MGSLINTITSPLGVKLFKGGPFPDKGLGDRALGNADLLKGYGSTFLQQSQGLPSVENMGYMQYVPALLKQQAAMAGVVDPFTGQGGQADTYALGGAQGEEFNRTASQINAARKTAVQRARASLSARGMTDSSTAAAAEQAINDQFDSLLQSQHATARTNAQQQRQAMLAQLTSQLQGLYGAQVGQQMDYAQLGTNMLGGATNIYSNAAANATAQSNASNQFWQGLIGAGIGMATGNPYAKAAGGGDNYVAPYLGGTLGTNVPTKGNFDLNRFIPGGR